MIEVSVLWLIIEDIECLFIEYACHIDTDKHRGYDMYMSYRHIIIIIIIIIIRAEEEEQ